MDVAAKVLADNLASLLNRSVDCGDQSEDGADVPTQGVRRRVNRAISAKALSRCVRALLLLPHNLASLIQEWAAMMGRSLIRHV